MENFLWGAISSVLGTKMLEKTEYDDKKRYVSIDYSYNLKKMKHLINLAIDIYIILCIIILDILFGVLIKSPLGNDSIIIVSFFVSCIINVLLFLRINKLILRNIKQYESKAYIYNDEDVDYIKQLFS